MYTNHHLLDGCYGSAGHAQGRSSLWPVMAFSRYTFPDRTCPTYRPQETEFHMGKLAHSNPAYSSPSLPRPEMPLTTLSSGTDRLSVHSWLFTKASEIENGKREETCHNSQKSKHSLEVIFGRGTTKAGSYQPPMLRLPWRPILAQVHTLSGLKAVVYNVYCTQQC